jgi:carnitine 3-dehydrogenase
VGFVADRLMEALWREALWLVNDDVATTEEIDAAVVYGCGLRWALMGTFLTFHLAGGEGGMRHMLHQFGPALKLPWTRLVAPELTDELIDKVADGCADQAAGRSIAELEARRDEFLVDLLALAQKYWPEAEGRAGRL